MLCINNNSIKHQSFVYTQLNDQTVLSTTNGFNTSHLFAPSLKWSNSTTWLLNRILSGATTSSQSRPENNGNERILHLPQISKAGALPSDGLMSYPGHSLWWWGGLTPLQRCSQCILQPQPTGLHIIVRKLQVLRSYNWFQMIQIIKTI